MAEETCSVEQQRRNIGLAYAGIRPGSGQEAYIFTRCVRIDQEVDQISPRIDQCSPTVTNGGNTVDYPSSEERLREATIIERLRSVSPWCQRTDA